MEPTNNNIHYGRHTVLKSDSRKLARGRHSSYASGAALVDPLHEDEHCPSSLPVASCRTSHSRLLLHTRLLVRIWSTLKVLTRARSPFR